MMGVSEGETNDHVRHELRQLLRLARFEAWSLAAIEDAIADLFRKGVSTQPVTTPDQQLAPSPSG
jgi:hypothetical protein